MLPQTPTSQTTTISPGGALKACQAGHPQTFAISTRSSPQAYTGLHDLGFAGPPSLGLPHWRYIHTWPLFCWAGSSKPAQVCRSSVSLGRATQACTGMHNLRSAGHTRKACRAGNTNRHDLCSAGLGPPGLHKPIRSLLCQATPPSPATPEVHTLTISVPPCHVLQAYTYLHNVHSTSLCPEGLPTSGPTNPQATICWAIVPPRPVKLGIHRHTGSPLCRPTPFRYTRPMLQRPTISPQL
jgi:hypothetical protein